MERASQINLAKEFQKLHTNEELLLIPNVWDAGSAIVFEKQGFNAVATTSAGIAYTLGYPDGEMISIDDVATCVSQITRRISIPLSVDIEGGYSDNPSIIKNNIIKLLDCGAVGFNIEDGRADGSLIELELMLEKINALKLVKEETGIDFVINARTCAYWLNVGDEEKKLQIAIERGNAFKTAGADCIFIPGVIDETTVKNLVNNINCPVNTILNGKYNNLKGLEEIGVSRLSVGSGPVRSMYNHVIEMADDLKDGVYTKIMNHSFTYGMANKYFK